MASQARQSEREGRIEKLRTLTDGVPVIAADAAIAHAERNGHGCPAPDELDAVLAAVDAWDGVRVPVNQCQPGVATPYTRVVTALTLFDSAIRHSIFGGRYA